MNNEKRLEWVRGLMSVHMIKICMSPYSVTRSRRSSSAIATQNPQGERRL